MRKKLPSSGSFPISPVYCSIVGGQMVMLIPAIGSNTSAIRLHVAFNKFLSGWTFHFFHHLLPSDQEMLNKCFVAK